MFEGIRSELIEINESQAAVGRKVSQAAHDFENCQHAYGLLKTKIDALQKAKVGWNLESLKYELEHLESILEQSAKTKDVIKQGQKEAFTRSSASKEFLTVMMDKVVGAHDITRQTLEDKVQKAILNVNTARKALEKCHEERRRAQQNYQAACDEERAILEEQNLAWTRISGLQSRMAALHQQKNDLEEQKMRTQKKFADAEQSIRTRHMLRKAELSDQSDADIQALKANKRKEYNTLHSKEMAALGVQPPCGAHFILVCDRSGSMNGVRWNKLNEAVRAFGKADVPGDNTFSMILFDHNAKVVMTDTSMSSFNQIATAKLASWPPDRGGTNFTSAWEATRMVAGSASGQRQTVVLFMSDGSSSPDDIAQAASKAEAIHAHCGGRLWTFFISFETTDKDLPGLLPMVRSGNGGALTITSEGGVVIQCMNPTNLESLSSMFVNLKLASSENLEQLRKAVDDHVKGMEQMYSADHKDAIKRIDETEKKQLEDLKPQKDSEVAAIVESLDGINTAMGVLEGDIEKERKMERELHAKIAPLKECQAATGIKDPQASSPTDGEDPHSVELAELEKALAAEQEACRSARRNVESFIKEQSARDGSNQSDWFASHKEQALVNQLLMLVGVENEAQKDIEHHVGMLFDTVYSNVKNIVNEVKAPQLQDRSPLEQAEAVRMYYQRKGVVHREAENITALQIDILNTVCRQAFQGSEDVSDVQIARAIRVVASTFDFDRLIWTGKDDQDGQQERKKWEEDLRKELKTAASVTVSKGAQKAKAAVDVAQEKVKRTKKKLREMRDQPGFDPDDLQAIEEDLDEDMKELENAKQEMAEFDCEFTLYNDILTHTMRTMQAVLRQELREKQVAELNAVLQKFDGIFANKVQPYIKAAKIMSAAGYGGSQLPKWSRDDSPEQTDKMLKDLELIPEESRNRASNSEIQITEVDEEGEEEDRINFLCGVMEDAETWDVELPKDVGAKGMRDLQSIRSDIDAKRGQRIAPQKANLDVEYWSFNSPVNPECVFPTDISCASVDSAEATLQNQGPNGTCVRYGIAAATEDQMLFLLKIPISASGFVDALMQHLDHAKGTSPLSFNGFSGNVQGTESQLWYKIHLAITDKTKQFKEDALKNRLKFPSMSSPIKDTQVISYNCCGVHTGFEKKSEARHCIYLTGYEDFHWRGQNSWGKSDPNPRISMHAAGTYIYNVKVVRVDKLASSGTEKAQRLYG